jgi:uncharacterized membrane protein YgdD (TMEM256/DUF423 family)
LQNRFAAFQGFGPSDKGPRYNPYIKPQSFITIGSASGFIAVAAGAFGAHGLQATLTPKMLDVWQTGAHYQLVHSVVLLFVGLLGITRPELAKPLNIIGWLFTAGIILFAGSLYALAVTDIKILGAITPLGGLAMLGGWVYLAITAGKLR